MSTRTLEEIGFALRAAKLTSDVPLHNTMLEELSAMQTAEADAVAIRVRISILNIEGDYHALLELLQESVTLFEELNDDINLEMMLNELGTTLWRTGDHAKALECMHRALALDEDLDYVIGTASILNNIGMVFADTGDYAKALEYYRRALDLFIQEGHKNFQANATGNIALIFTFINDQKSALEYVQRALSLQIELGNRAGESNSLSIQGNILMKMERYEEAEISLRRSILVADEFGHSAEKSSCLLNLVSLLNETKRFDEALKLLDDNDPLLSIGNARTGKKVHRAQVLEACGDSEGARDLLLMALEETTSLNRRGSMASICLALRNIFKTLGDFESYIKYNEQHLQLTNEINGIESTRKLTMQEKEREMVTERMDRQRERDVLYGALPKHVADRLIKGEDVNDHIDSAGVMFLDIVGFTTLSSTLTSQQVITLLDRVFGICDEACNQNGVTRIKTIGDSYMAVKMPNAEGQLPNSIVAIANAALQIIERVKETDFKSLLSLQVPSMSSSDSKSLQLRVGLHCGPVTAGVLGKERLQYDVWGDTVNVASRMESTGESNRIHVSDAFASALNDEKLEPGTGNLQHELGTWHLAPRGETEVKGKGMMQTYWLERR